MEPGRGTTRPQAQQDDAGVVDRARDTAQQLASKAREQVGNRLESGVSSGTHRAGEMLGSVAQSLLYSSQQLRDQDQQRVGGYVEQAANKVNDLADYLQRTEPGELTARVERFARREPALFLGGVFALGFLGARFLKSSRPSQPAASDRTGIRSIQRNTSGLDASSGIVDREVPLPVAMNAGSVIETEIVVPAPAPVPLSGTAASGSRPARPAPARDASRRNND